MFRAATTRALLLAGLATAPLAATAADSFYCGDRLVEIGARGDAVAQRCGPPDFSDAWEEELVQKPGEAFERSTAVPYAEWIYDFGSERFIRVLSFRDGVLKKIDIRGYGPERNGVCTTRSIAIGETKYEVLRKCGEPSSRRQARETRTEPIDQLHRRRYAITTERWLYHPASGNLAWTVDFRNRRVVGVETGTDRP